MALRNKKNKEIESERDRAIEISAQMQGNLTFKDPVNLKINGNFQGNLETKGTLTVGTKAKIEANINGDNIVIAGKVNGDIVANKMLVLMPTAMLNGNISTSKLNIVEGAIFQGSCKMKMAGNLLDIKEVSSYLEIDVREIEKMANSGEIPGQKSGEAWKFEKIQIDNWAASGQVE
ncbi:MAG: polymer-forming cytoskeletal protein [Candidatus Zapsychrus exili]|nr:polymer-forming cytoskeletal protein [Candidatus Zapsychrus exili]